MLSLDAQPERVAFTQANAIRPALVRIAGVARVVHARAALRGTVFPGTRRTRARSDTRPCSRRSHRRLPRRSRSSRWLRRSHRQIEDLGAGIRTSGAAARRTARAVGRLTELVGPAIRVRGTARLAFATVIDGDPDACA